MAAIFREKRRKNTNNSRILAEKKRNFQAQMLFLRLCNLEPNLSLFHVKFTFFFGEAGGAAPLHPPFGS